MTSKEGTELSYLNIRIIKFPYSFSIDQTSYIKDTNLAQWFTNTSEKLYSAPTPFKSDITFELALEDTLPATPYELHVLEERYLVKFSAHIGRIIHIMQYTRTDIMYTINCLSIHVGATSSPLFQDIKHLIHYLHGFPHCTVIYPAGLYVTTTHDIYQ